MTRHGIPADAVQSQQLTLTEQALGRAVDALEERIRHVVTELGARPELGYAEFFAVEVVTQHLVESGVHVETGLAGMPTALRARYGSGSPHIAVLAEYDALPDIGHGCGHNVIAASALGAFLALVDSRFPGTVDLIGCPAEESTVENAGGKIRLLAGGVFDGVDTVLASHPYDANILATEGNLAVQGIDMEFTGLAAHAAMRAEDGLNALDAAVTTYQSLAMLRQHLRPGQKVHGIFTHGGTSPNVVPERAALRYRMRAPTMPELGDLADRVRACARGGAEATGCTVSFDEFMPPYADLRLDPELVAIARAVAADLGMVLESAQGRIFGSTDLGNVSHVVPTLEFGVALAGPGVAPHTHEFAAAATGPEAVVAAVLAARALSLCAWRLAGTSGTDVKESVMTNGQ